MEMSLAAGIKTLEASWWQNCEKHHCGIKQAIAVYKVLKVVTTLFVHCPFVKYWLTQIQKRNVHPRR